MAHDTDDTTDHWYTDRKFTISVTAVLFVLPLSIPKEIGFQKYARYKTLSLAQLIFPPLSVNVPFRLHGMTIMSGLLFLLCSALSVIGTWYVTIVVIIKYIFPDKNMTQSPVSAR